jgi:O-antigen ligase
MIAVLAAFVFQAVYAILVRRYEAPPISRRSLGVAAMIAVLGVGTLGLVMIGEPRVEKMVDISARHPSLSSDERAKYWGVAWEEWKKYPLTGTGAGTFSYTWLQNRPDLAGVQQVHNVYLEQGTETGIVAFLALTGFAALLAGYLARAAWRAGGEQKVLLGGLTGAVIVYLVSSALEWHWYIPPSTIFFFILAGVAVKFASETEQDT